MRVVRSSWSRGPVAMSFEVVAVGSSVDEAEEPVHSGISRTMVESTVAPVEAEVTAEEGPVCVSGGPSEEAGVLLCGEESSPLEGRATVA